MHLDQLSIQSTRAATWCAIALGFSIPVSVALDNVLLGVMLLCWLLGARFADKFAVIRDSRLAPAAFALFALLLAGIAWADEAAEGWRILAKYGDLAMLGIFITLFRAAGDRQRAGAALIAALVLTLVLSCLTWAGLLTKGWLVIGHAAEPEVFKKYLTQSVLTAGAAYWFALLARDAATPSARQLWLLLAALAALNVVIMLPGRSGQITLAVLGLAFAFSTWRVKGVATVGAVLLITAAVFVLGYAPENSRFSAVVRDFKAWQSGNASHTSTGQRLDFAIHSLAIVREHPLAGVGTGGFAAAYAQQTKDSGLLPTVNPHNEYLNLAVQLGIAGLLAAVWLFAMVWRHARALPTALERDLARGLAVTFAIGCLFNSMLMDHVEGLFFAWSAGVLFGGYDPARLRSHEGAT